MTAEQYAHDVSTRLADGGVTFDMWSTGDVDAPTIEALLTDAYNAALAEAVVSETVEVTPEQAKWMCAAVQNETDKRAHLAAGEADLAIEDQKARIENVGKAVEAGVPLKQVQRFVFGPKVAG